MRCAPTNAMRIPTLLAIALLISLILPGCSYMTAQGRREMAYRHYVNKSMKTRDHRIAKAQAANRKMKHVSQGRSEVPSEPIVSSGVGPVSEPMSAPITVSASDNGASSSEPTP
jgi:hypothetical protein